MPKHICFAKGKWHTLSRDAGENDPTLTKYHACTQKKLAKSCAPTGGEEETLYIRSSMEEEEEQEEEETEKEKTQEKEKEREREREREKEKEKEKNKKKEDDHKNSHKIIRNIMHTSKGPSARHQRCMIIQC